MSTMRLTALRKSTFNHSFSYIRFCSSKSGDDNRPPPEALETKGALKNFMSQTSAPTEGEGLWAKLRRDAGPATAAPEAKKWTPAESSPLGPGREGATPGTPRKAPARSFNPRQTGGKKPSGPSEESSAGPAQAFLGGAAGKKNKKGGDFDEAAEMEKQRQDNDDLDDEEEIPPEILNVLEEDKFGKEIAEGKGVDTNGMDAIDKFLAKAYFESHKTSDGVVREVLVSQAYKRVRLPQPRGIKELIGVITPKIHSAPAGTDAYKLGQEAWGVLSKNYFFQEKDKSFMANEIARKYQLAIDGMNKVYYDEDGKEMEYPDVIFSPTFRRGYAGMVEEERLLKKIQTKNMKAYAFGGDNTNWKVTAVVDEDDLDFSGGGEKGINERLENGSESDSDEEEDVLSPQELEIERLHEEREEKAEREEKEKNDKKKK